MQYIWTVVESIIAVAAIVPFATFVVLYFVLNRYMEDKKKAKSLTFDITTGLLVIIVSSMINVIFRPGINSIWIILFLMLVSFGLLGGSQMRNHGQADLTKAFRIVWRISFLLLSVLYIIFLFVGIGQSFFRV